MPNVRVVTVLTALCALATPAFASAEVLCVQPSGIITLSKKACPKKWRTLPQSLLPQGPAGADGQQGAQGPAGETGATGPQGTAGTNGTTGTNGTNGTDGIDGGIFNVSGSSGTDNIGTGTFAIGDVGAADTLSNKAVTLGPCSQLEYTVVLQNAPGTNQSWDVVLRIQDPGDFGTNFWGGKNVCTIAGNAKSCTGTLTSVGLSADKTVALSFTDFFGGAAATKATWNFRCLAE